jgi:hypothetical protein
MRRRRLVVTVLAATVFVGVLLVMISADPHVVSRGLPVATICALAAAFVSWRWSVHVD